MNENEDKGNVSDIEISDLTKFHDPQTLFLDDDDDFEDFNPPLKDSTPYHSKGYKGKYCKQDLEAEPKTVADTETKHNKKRKNKRQESALDIETLNESHSNDYSLEDSRPNWEDPNLHKSTNKFIKFSVRKRVLSVLHFCISLREKLDTSKVPRTFKIKIPYGDWRKILTQALQDPTSPFNESGQNVIVTRVKLLDIPRSLPTTKRCLFESNGMEKTKKGKEKVADTYTYTAHAQAYDLTYPELFDAVNYSEVPKLTAG
ncbi:unnamed protein product [Orchesella dallaii]|uniref:Uncharacterized protein n=1 Tax=Orchesella dallaii TaxID=48710 RepID=A0ABP1RK46_9HEXA